MSIYFMIDTTGTYLKIGYATNIRTRISYMMPRPPGVGTVDLVFMCAIPGDRVDEAVWRRRFEDRKICKIKNAGDWFLLDNRLLNEIAVLMRRPDALLAADVVTRCACGAAMRHYNKRCFACDNERRKLGRPRAPVPLADDAEKAISAEIHGHLAKMIAERHERRHLARQAPRGEHRRAQDDGYGLG